MLRRPLSAARSERLTLPEAYFAAGGALDPWGLGGLATFSVGGQTYTVPISTTMQGQKAESIATSFQGYTLGGLQGNGVIFTLIATRLRVFSEARFQWQKLNNGRPGDLFGNAALQILEIPWPGGTTGDLLALMILHSDLAGNAYVASIRGQLVVMRPDWVEILLADRLAPHGPGTVGMEKVGYTYYEGGKNSGSKPVTFLADEVCHFAPIPDPLAWYRGMSWLTPVVREIQSDGAMTAHKMKFFENAATPNLAVKLQIADPVAFGQWVDKMEESHAGVENAYKTLYTGAGADVTLIGQNMREMEFKVTQSAGEVRLAQAAGVPPAVANLQSGLEGSTLNAGNFGQARRQFGDMTLSPLWRNVAGSLQVLLEPAPSATRLWVDKRDIPFLLQDKADEATIQQANATAIRELFMAGFTPETIVAAVTSGDLTLLKHTGTYSVQVQTPGTTSTKMPSTVDEPPAGPEGSSDVTETPSIPAVTAPPAPLAGAGNGNRP